jgi:hypothetical protein
MDGVGIVDVEGFLAVFDEYWVPVVRYRSRRLGVDAGEQVAADVFAEAFVDRAYFDPRRGSVRALLFGVDAGRRVVRSPVDPSVATVAASTSGSGEFGGCWSSRCASPSGWTPANGPRGTRSCGRA